MRRGRGNRAAARHGWHVDAAVSARYADGSLPEPDAWSLEKHVEACGRCAAAVSAAVRSAGAATAVLDDVREAVLLVVAGPGGPAGSPAADPIAVHVESPIADQLDSPIDGRAGAPPGSTRPRPAAARGLGRLTSRSRHRVLWAAGPALRGSWLFAVLLVCAGAAGLAYGSGFHGARPLLLTLAPVVPLAGVGLSYGPHADPMYEISAGTPSGGLRLLLARAATVLGVSLPILTAVGALLPGLPGAPGAAAWLLPALALTLAALALGSLIGCRAASFVLTAGWFSAVLLPVFAVNARDGGGILPTGALALQLARYLSGPSAQGFWGAAAVLCAGLLALRRHSFDIAPGSGPGSHRKRLEHR